jgi:hypothetical protein
VFARFGIALVVVFGTSESGVAFHTCALEPVQKVVTGACVLAGFTCTLVDIELAVSSGEPGNTFTLVTVYQIYTESVVPTNKFARFRAVVVVDLALSPAETLFTNAHVMIDFV